MYANVHQDFLDNDAKAEIHAHQTHVKTEVNASIKMEAHIVNVLQASVDQHVPTVIHAHQIHVKTADSV